jgi:molybdopterin adenylyltransferase
MAGIDVTKAFQPLQIAILTISDTRTIETDTSGQFLADSLEGAGHVLQARDLVQDEVYAIRGKLMAWIEDPAIDVILTTGGTGLSPRDVTPEAVKPLFRRELDGFAVLFHQVSFQTVGVATLQSRAFAGQAGDTFIFCLPGSPGACRDGWEQILALEFDSRYRPCSIVSHIARLNGAQS